MNSPPEYGNALKLKFPSPVAERTPLQSTFDSIAKKSSDRRIHSFFRCFSAGIPDFRSCKSSTHSVSSLPNGIEHPRDGQLYAFHAFSVPFLTAPFKPFKFSFLPIPAKLRIQRPLFSLQIFRKQALSTYRRP